MTPEDEAFNEIERRSKVKQEMVRAMYEPHDCPKCAENKEARNLWRKLALELWDRYKDKR
jgi:ribosomal protein L37AE/L43A